MKDLIKESLDKILTSITDAKIRSGRKVDVTLVGVSKFQSLEKMFIAHELGLTNFGENYVQEGISKVNEFRTKKFDAKFHFIGGLQSNKLKDAVKYFDVIHTIDSKKLVDTCVKAVVASEKEKQDILIQVNVSGELQKSGVDPSECGELLAHALSRPELNVIGLMTIGSFTDNLGVKLSEFRHLARLKSQLESEFPCSLPHLSMGMSDDYTIAIEEGATIVRIGSLLFGERDTKS
jgi:pyridoxal phosphate enzyme (YggS family)